MRYCALLISAGLALCTGCRSTSVGSDELYARAVQCMEEGNEVEAVVLFRQLLIEHPGQMAVALKSLRHLRDARRVHQLRHPDEYDKRRLNAKGKLMQRLRNIILPKVTFTDTPVSKALESLRDASIAADPNKVGIRILNLVSCGIWQYPSNSASTDSSDGGFTDDDDDFGDDDDEPEPSARAFLLSREPRITLQQSNIRLVDAVDAICAQSGLLWKAEDNCIIVREKFVSFGGLRFFPVDPSLFKGMDHDAVKKYFTDRGVTFATGRYGGVATVSYDPGTSKLIMRNSRSNIQLVEAIIRSQSKERKQIRVSVTHVVLGDDGKIASTQSRMETLSVEGVTGTSAAAIGEPKRCSSYTLEATPKTDEKERIHIHLSWMESVKTSGREPVCKSVSPKLVLHENIPITVPLPKLAGGQSEALVVKANIITYWGAVEKELQREAREAAALEILLEGQ